MDQEGASLEKLLLEHGLLNDEQLRHVKEKAKSEGKKISDVIREEQLVYPEPLAQLKAETVGVPYVDLNVVRIDPAAMEGVADRAAATYRFVAFGKDEGRLQVAMVDPDDYQALEAIRFIAKKQSLVPEIYCASEEAIERALTPKAQDNADEALRDFGEEIQQSSELAKDDNDTQDKLEGVPVTKVFAVIMRHAIEGMASDVHIEPFGSELRVRFRIQGELHTSLLLSLDVHQSVISRVKVLAGMQVSVSNIPQDGRFTFSSDNQAYSVRVAIMPTIHGEKITLHLVDTTKAAPSFSDLGFAGKSLDVLKEKLQNSKGLVMVAGPDGSGKSTTLNAILSFLNTPDTCIATVEETIEYEIAGVTQTQIAPSRDVTYENVLQNLLRQDVDVVMAEEVRTGKIAHLLTKGALAGRLMLSTIHAQDSLHSIPQLTDLGITPYVLSSSLRLVVSQRLVPRLCQKCRQQIEVTDETAEAVEKELQEVDTETLKAYEVGPEVALYDSVGCDECNGRKTDGQVAIFDVLNISKDMSAAIASGGNYDMLKDIASKEGHVTLKQDGFLKALEGMVRYNDVVRVAG